MQFLIIFLTLVGLSFLISGFHMTFLAKDVVVTSRLLDVLTFGFFLSAVKSSKTQAYIFKFTGWKKIAFGSIFLLVGAFLLYTATSFLLTLQKIPLLSL